MIIRAKFVSQLVCAALGVLAVSGAALADKPHWARGYGDRHDHGHRDRVRHHDADYAQVTFVEPIVRRVRVSTPVQDCWNEARPVYRDTSGTVARSTLVGGLIGAAVGSHIGRAHGGRRDPSLVVGGSMVGAVIGNSIGEDRAARRGAYREVGYDDVRHCQASYRDDWEESIEGYRVTYVYSGRSYMTRLPYDPGPRLRVNVDVRPGY